MKNRLLTGAGFVVLVFSCGPPERPAACARWQRPPGPPRYESGPHNLIAQPGERFSVQVDARVDRTERTLEAGAGILEVTMSPKERGPTDLPVVEAFGAEVLDGDGGLGGERILRDCGSVHNCEGRAFVVITDPRAEGGPAYLRFNIDLAYVFGESEEEYEAAPATLNVNVTLPLGPLDAGP